MNTQPGFQPFPKLAASREDDRPPEPAIATVLAWQNAENPVVAVRGDLWHVTGVDDPLRWDQLLAMIGKARWHSVGVAQTWRPLVRPAPERPRNAQEGAEQ